MTVATLNRRSFFQKLGGAQPKEEGRMGIFGKMKPVLSLGNQELPMVPPPATTISLNGGLEPYTGPWGQEQAAHLLRRTGFGVRKADLDELTSLTMDAAVEKVLEIPSDPVGTPINNYYFPGGPDGYEDPNVAAGADWTTAAYDGEAEGFRIESFRGWWYRLMLNQGVSILERMTLFWHNHFATQTEAVFYGRMNFRHNQMLRSNALGNFKSFVKEVTLDPMMLIYLNGYLNNKNAPDENYARELQELFTIGKDNPDHYTEDDVVAAARVLTGWSFDFNNFETNIEPQFYPSIHDLGDKQFSAYYNNTIIPGSTDGEAELDALLDMIFQRNDVAEYICRKLYRWFIYYNIDATTEQNVIQPLAQIFRDNNYEILPVMEVLLKSTHFYDALNKGCFIKTPVDMVIGTLKTFGISYPGIGLWEDFVMDYLLSLRLIDLQMLPGDPPNVAGWQAFRQVPQYYRMWINGDTAKNRVSYTKDLIFPFIGTSLENNFRIDPIAFASQFSDPSDPAALVNEMVTFLLPQPISDTKKLLLKNILLSGLPSDSYWTIAWFDYVNNPSSEMAVAVVNSRLSVMLDYLLRLPEYQLA